ncbi:MAG: hypothetical protein AAF649_08080 [Verrucomicrobiota bacterium]
MDHGVRIYESFLDDEEALLNSAIPADQAALLYQKICRADPGAIARQIFKKDDIFESVEELQNYFIIWWNIFKIADSQNSGVLIHAD